MNIELKVPPVAVVFITAILMWLGTFLTSFVFETGFNHVIAICLAIGGVLLIKSGLSSFNRAQTTSNPLAPGTASTLVTGGIYRYSRNPMYLGFAIILAALGFYLSNIISVLLVIVFVLYMNRYQIQPEERILEEKFGQSFKNYKEQTRRWL